MRTAVIGLGEAGTSIHLPALRGLPAVTVVGAADPDDARRRAVAEKAGIPVFADVAEMLANSEPELVIVASPPALHAAHCMASLEAGTHVVCEKPFAASVREARAVVARAAELNRQVSINHEFRAMPVFRDLLAAVRAESGGPRVVQVWQLIDRNPAAEPGWRGQLRRRSLYEAGVHLVDLVLQAFAETPHTVRATCSSGDGHPSGSDAIVLATLEFARGRLAQVIQCRVHRGDRQYFEVRADTDDKSFRASFGGRARLTAGLLRSTRPHVAVERGASGIAWRERGAGRSVFARNGSSPLVAATRDVIHATVQAIRGRARLPFPASDGVETLRVVAAAYLAAELGHAVSLDGPEREATEALTLAE